MLKKHFQIHIDLVDTTFPLNNLLLQEAWFKKPFYNTLTSNLKANLEKLLKKLVTLNITTLPQIQDPTNTCVLIVHKFQQRHNTNPI